MKTIRNLALLFTAIIIASGCSDNPPNIIVHKEYKPGKTVLYDASSTCKKTKDERRGSVWECSIGEPGSAKMASLDVYISTGGLFGPPSRGESGGAPFDFSTLGAGEITCNDGKHPCLVSPDGILMDCTTCP